MLPTTRALVFLGILLLPFDLLAQGTVVRYFVATGPLDGSALKQAIEVLRSLDPEAVVSAHEYSLKVRLGSGVSVEAALIALNSTGTTYVVHSGGRSRSGDPEPPVRVNTGDTEGDDARYQAAKQDWIAQYPEAYQATIVPESTLVTPTMKDP